MELRLLEALTRCRLVLDGADNDPKALDKQPHIGENQYEVYPMNEKLQQYKTGWTKYSLFVFPKVVNTDNKFVKVSSVLHLIHAIEPDIIIARVAKYSQKTKSVDVRYIIYQGNKQQLCTNLKELYLALTRTYNYEGKVLTVNDFKRPQ